jgi:hypothetical protein
VDQSEIYETPEEACAKGGTLVLETLMMLNLRRANLEKYMTTVSDPGGFAPYAGTVLELTDDSIEILRSSIKDGLNDISRKRLEKNGRAIEVAVSEMVEFQKANQCWAAGEMEEE